MKLFGFGNKSEKTTPKVLGPHLSELFGGAEGAEMIVEATESGLAAIEAAESRLAEFNQQMSQVDADKQAAVDAAVKTATEAGETALKAEQEAHKATQQEFADFKAENGAEHTQVEKTEDAVNAGIQTEPESKIRKDEEKARAEGEKIHNSKESKSV